ncbi:MAG: nucleotide exchange factor GrpE [Planctomycetota bacterium]|jgi:molecular chaperone GrpE
MSDEKTFEREHDPAPAGQPNGEPQEPEFKVDDRRHWQRDDESVEAAPAEVEPAKPSILDEYRERAEAAESKLLEYIEAFKRHKNDQEQVRERLARDVGRRVDLMFGELVAELLETLDDLDLGLEHVQGVEGAEPLAEGVVIARNRFLATLQKHGVAKISPEGTPFDPNEAEAVRVDPVDSADADHVVTETLQPGYKLRDRVIRAARVAVGQFKSPK